MSSLSRGPHVAAAGLMLASFVAAPALATPVCRSFERPGTRDDPAAAALPDGSVWYAHRAGNRLMRITPQRAVVAALPADAASGQLSAITIGGDGNVWYAKTGADRVGRIPPGGGAGAEFQLEPNSFPMALGTDRAGRVWVAASVKNYLARVEPDGSLATIPAPRQGSRRFSPQGMTVGADGNLWFTERGTNSIVRFDVASGAFDWFPIPTPGAHPEPIGLGGDGNVWFGLNTAKALGAITPAGQIREYPIGVRVESIVGTPDGSTWFTTRGRQAGRVTPDGELELFDCADGLGTAVVGPGGRPWFFASGRVYYVEDARDAKPVAPVAVGGGVAAAPAVPPRAKAAPASPAATAPQAASRPSGPPSPFATMTMQEFVERVPGTKGLVVVQVTSNDPGCTHCITSNASFDSLATRRPKDATYWRVSFEPWRSAFKDPYVQEAGIRGLPTTYVYLDGAWIDTYDGTATAEQYEAWLFRGR